MYFLWAFTNDTNRLEEFSWCKGQSLGNDKWKNLLSSGNEVSIGSSSFVLSDQWLNTKKEHSNGLFWNCEILLLFFRPGEEYFKILNPTINQAVNLILGRFLASIRISSLTFLCLSTPQLLSSSFKLSILSFLTSNDCRGEE